MPPITFSTQSGAGRSKARHPTPHPAQTPATRSFPTLAIPIHSEPLDYLELLRFPEGIDQKCPETAEVDNKDKISSIEEIVFVGFFI